MNELALFAGAGGGILGGHLLGWRTVCAVEWEPYPASVLCARQNDGFLPPFPIWDDIQTFDGRPWRGIVDVISGGFPCQDISAAGKGAGIDGERSGMWREMARVVSEVRPRFVFVENSPMLVTRGLERVLGDLTSLGYDTRWTVMGAADVGAPHQRDRIWIRSVLANTNLSQCKRERESIGVLEGFPRVGDGGAMVPNTTSKRQQGQGQYEQSLYKKTNCYGQTNNVKPIGGSNIWATEPDVGRVANGVAARMDRLTAIGNGQVSEVARRAWEALNDT
jgi:DNA (cytosine-5)-methyltransferase 1